MNNISVELAIESDNFGLSITHDADNHKILYSSRCSHCNEYFESEKIKLYCDECVKKSKKG